MQDPLRVAYASIREQADGMADSWPHAEKMRAHCHRDAQGRWQPPAFADGDGPIGVYAMLGGDADAVAVLRRCRDAFEHGFLEEVRALLDQGQREAFEQLLFVPAESTWHTCVSVFHEHPSLIDEATRAHWRRVDAKEAEALGAAVAAGCATARMRAPRLTLDALCLCADGALIAGFVDESGQAAALREACSREGTAFLGGQLTSRPKKLLHVTLGRLLGAPPDLRPEQAAAIASALRRFHAVPLAEQLGTPAPQTFALRSVSLMRDVVWWMTEAEELGSWPLPLASPDSDE